MKALVCYTGGYLEYDKFVVMSSIRIWTIQMKRIDQFIWLFTNVCDY